VKRSLDRDAVIVAAIAAASLAARLAPAATLGVFQDEGLYWWQGYEGMSFCPHPPVTALLVRAATACLGHGVLGLRAVPLLAGTAAVVLAYVAARELGGRRAGLWAAALFASCPLFFVLGVLVTPDATLLPEWLLFMYAAWRALRQRSNTWWVIAGVVLAVGLYTKYMMVLVVPSLALALLTCREGRAALRTPGPWVAVGLGLVLFVPVFMAWDLAHGSPTLHYQLRSRHEWEFGSREAFRYILNHLGAISPVLALGVWWAVARRWVWWLRRRPGAVWAASFALFPLLFFLLPGAFTRREMVRVQWDAAGYAAGIVVLALFLRERGTRGRTLRRRRMVAAAGMAVAGLIIGAVLVGALWPGLAVRAGVRPPARRMMGWRELAGRLTQLRRESPGPVEAIVTESFAPAMCLGFHLDMRRSIYSLDAEQNREYGVQELLALWGMDQGALERDTKGQEVLYVHSYHISKRTGRSARAERVHQVYEQVQKVADVYVELSGRRQRHFGVFRCRGLKGSR